MFAPVFPTLKASAAVRAIVDTRVYRHGEAPQREPGSPLAPYVAWQQFATPENTLSEPPAVDRVTVDVTVYHPDDKGVVSLAKAVRDAIEPRAHMTGTTGDGREPETRLFFVRMSFDWFLDRG